MIRYYQPYVKFTWRIEKKCVVDANRLADTIRAELIVVCTDVCANLHVPGILFPKLMSSSYELQASVNCATRSISAESRGVLPFSHVNGNNRTSWFESQRGLPVRGFLNVIFTLLC